MQHSTCEGPTTLTPPTSILFLITLVIAVIALLAALSVLAIIPIPAFWLMAVAYILLALGCIVRGL